MNIEITKFAIQHVGRHFCCSLPENLHILCKSQLHGICRQLCFWYTLLLNCWHGMVNTFACSGGYLGTNFQDATKFVSVFKCPIDSLFSDPNPSNRVVGFVVLSKPAVFSNVDHITFGTFSPTTLAALLIAALKSLVNICPLASSPLNFHITFVVQNIVNEVSTQQVADCQTAAASA